MSLRRRGIHYHSSLYDAEAGPRFANRLRLIIENSPAKTSDALLGIEASFGVDVYMKGEELTGKEYVEKVDSFLYLTKKEGRYKVCHSTFSDEGKSGSVPKKLNSERSSPSAS